MGRAEWGFVALACGGLLLGSAHPAESGAWPRAFVGTLPDGAFAIVETGPDGRRRRHLPHHGLDGRVDAAHLRSALARLRQVRWADPADAERARQHLREHLASLRQTGSPEREGPAARLTPGRAD